MYSELQKIEIINEICEKISKGQSLRSVLKSENMPDIVTFYKWIDSNIDFVKQYARATELRAESIFEDIIKICDATEDDIIYDEKGNEIPNHNVINRDRLRVDSRKWMLAKMMPKKYGDKVELEHSGSIENKTDLSQLSTEELIRRAEAMRTVERKKSE